MSPIRVVEPIPVTKFVTLLAKHPVYQYLVYVHEGDIKMDATVDLTDPLLHLYVSAELIETGNSLAWLTKEQMIATDLDIIIYTERN